MIIKRIYIKSFGNLTDLEVIPDSAVNIIYGENESGKSTLAAFIKFMFYGFPQKRAKEGVLSEQDRYISWETHGASGSLELVCGDGRQYRIEREVYRSGKKATGSVKIIDLANNEKIPGDPCDIFLFGTPEDIFTRTVFISQANGTPVDSETVHASIENMLSGADESVNTKKALSKLDSARITLLYKNEKGGRIYNIRREIKVLGEKKFALSHQSEQISQLKEQITKDAELYKNTKSRSKALEDKIEALEASGRLSRIENTQKSKNEINELEKKANEFELSVTKNGFLPRREYHKRLEGCIRDYYAALDDIRKATNERDELKRRYNEYSERDIGKDIPLDAIIKNASSEDKKREKLKKLSRYFLVAALCSTLVFIISLFLMPSLSLFGALIFVVFTVFFAGLRIMMKNSEKAIREMLEGVGANSPEELALFRKNQEKMSEKRDILAKSIADAEQSIKSGDLLLKKHLEQFNYLSQKYGFSSNDIRKCEEFKDNVGEIVDTLEKNLFALSRKKEELRINLESYTEDELTILKEKAALLTEESDTPIRSRLITAKADKRAVDDALEVLQDKLSDEKLRLTSLLTNFEDEGYISKKISDLAKKEESLTFFYNALMLAAQSLEKASASSRDRIAPRLSALSSEMISAATEGKYKSISADSKLRLSYTHLDRTNDIAHLSEGTKDIVYLSFRTALILTLFKDIPPVIMDEVFSGMDDSRLSSTLRAVLDFSKKHSAQVFIFTPTRREEEASECMDINLISL